MEVPINPKLTALALALLSAACSPMDGDFPYPMEGQGLRVILPAAPASWAFLPDLRMSLSWRDPEGKLRSAAAAPGSCVGIEVERGFPQAIMALPLSSDRALLPAGALYPEALAERGAGPGSEELRLDWRGGYAASLARSLEGGGVDPFGYDLYALVDAAIGRAGDPWFLPALEAARRLAAHDFRIDLYRKPELFLVNLPGSGPWAPESPFAPAPEAAGPVELPEGLWRFVGKEAELYVSVDSAGSWAMVEL